MFTKGERRHTFFGYHIKKQRGEKNQIKNVHLYSSFFVGLPNKRKRVSSPGLQGRVLSACARVGIRTNRIFYTYRNHHKYILIIIIFIRNKLKIKTKNKIKNRKKAFASSVSVPTHLILCVPTTHGDRRTKKKKKEQKNSNAFYTSRLRRQQYIVLNTKLFFFYKLFFITIDTGVRAGPELTFIFRFGNYRQTMAVTRTLGENV